MTPWTLVHQALLSMGFPRQEYWSGLPFPSPRDLPDPEIELMSLALVGRFFTAAPSGSPGTECVKMLVSQLCPTLFDPMDYSPAGSSIHGIPNR